MESTASSNQQISEQTSVPVKVVEIIKQTVQQPRKEKQGKLERKTKAAQPKKGKDKINTSVKKQGDQEERLPSILEVNTEQQENDKSVYTDTSLQVIQEVEEEGTSQKVIEASDQQSVSEVESKSSKSTVQKRKHSPEWSNDVPSYEAKSGPNGVKTNCSNCNLSFTDEETYKEHKRKHHRLNITINENLYKFVIPIKKLEDSERSDVEMDCEEQPRKKAKVLHLGNLKVVPLENWTKKTPKPQLSKSCEMIRDEQQHPNVQSLRSVVLAQLPESIMQISERTDLKTASNQQVKEFRRRPVAKKTGLKIKTVKNQNQKGLIKAQQSEGNKAHHSQSSSQEINHKKDRENVNNIQEEAHDKESNNESEDTPKKLIIIKKL